MGQDVVSRLTVAPSAPAAGFGTIYPLGASDAALNWYYKRPDATVLQIANLNEAQTWASGQIFVAPVLGTPASGTLTNCTGLPIAGTTGYGAGVATFLATPSSANLLAAITDETGTGALVFGTSPAITTSLTSPSTTFTLLATPTTVNFAQGASTGINLGHASGTNTVAGATTFSQTVTGSTNLFIAGATTSSFDAAILGIFGATTTTTWSIATKGDLGAAMAFSNNAHYASGAWKYTTTAAVTNYYQSNGAHVFRVAASGTAGNNITWITGLSIADTGAVTIPGTLGVTGALTAASLSTTTPLNSITAGVAQYKSGTWTPAATNLTTVGSPTFEGSYSRIGNRVEVTLIITPGTSTASTAGSTYFTGLPYDAVTSTTDAAGSVGDAAAVSLGTCILYGASPVRLYTPTWGANGNAIAVSITYRTNDAF